MKKRKKGAVIDATAAGLKSKSSYDAMVDKIKVKLQQVYGNIKQG